MSQYTRRNVWLNGGTFDNSDILWYATAIKEMQNRSLDDKSSWWFFAAMHGTSLTFAGVPPSIDWANLTANPSVPITPMPSSAIVINYWNQCQHQSWYFLPWHRGYLFAVEEHLRSIVIQKGGPDSWSLPYWNYLGSGSQFRLPPAFAQTHMPDGTENSLYIEARNGPNNDKNVYVDLSDVDESCLQNNRFSGRNGVTPYPGFGGPRTSFNWGGTYPSGNLEANPHNDVHVDVGGANGLMTSPITAALDPIFYIHHCNIDRIWAHWNANGHTNPTENAYTNGPKYNGDRPFICPRPSNDRWEYTPADVDDTQQLDYTYDDIQAALLQPSGSKSLDNRLASFGLTIPTENLVETMSSHDNENIQLIQASEFGLEVPQSGVVTSIKLPSSIFDIAGESALFFTPESSLPEVNSMLERNFYLQLENVTGDADNVKLQVFINGHLVKSIALFGLSLNNLSESHHAGSGSTYLVEITQTLLKLRREQKLSSEPLDIKIIPKRVLSSGCSLNIGRVALYTDK